MGQASFAVAFLGGLAAILSPCAALLLPAFFALTFTRTGTLVGRVLLFWLGLLATMVPLGVAAGGLGGALAAHREGLLRLLGALLVLFGLLAATGRGLALPSSGRVPGARRDPASPLAILLLGAGYGLAGGCTGPVLGSVLTVAVLGGDPLRAGVLMVVYCLGMVLPLLLVSLLWQRSRPVMARWLRPRPLALGRLHTTWGQLLTGLLLAAPGLPLLLGRGGISLLDVDAQYALENSLARLGGRLADGWLLAPLVLLVGALAWHWLGEREDRG